MRWYYEEEVGRRRRRRAGAARTRARVCSPCALLFRYNWKDRAENKGQGQFMAALPSGVGGWFGCSDGTTSETVVGIALCAAREISEKER